MGPALVHHRPSRCPVSFPLRTATIHYNSTAPAQSKPAAPTNDKLTVDGKAVTPTAYKINNATQSVTITTGQAYQKVGTELAGAPANSQTAASSDNAVYINGENYFKIRDLGQKLDFDVGWTAERGMFIGGSKSYDPAINAKYPRISVWGHFAGQARKFPNGHKKVLRSTF